MKLEKIKIFIDEILKNFIDKLGFDGEYYTSISKCTIYYADILVPGCFLTAKSKTLYKFIEKMNLDESKKKYIYYNGLILINQKYKNKLITNDMIVTFLHEEFHSKRVLLINEQSQKNINSYFYENGRFVKADNKMLASFVDASQEIIHASIDTSKKATEKYKNMSLKQKEELSFYDEKYGEQMLFQQNVDEILVEMMSIISYQIFLDSSKTIMDVVKCMNRNYHNNGIHAMTNIIIRHNNLDLFKWMIDPLTYQMDDINYDYFGHYINSGDLKDVQIIKNNDELFFYDIIDEEKTKK